VRALALVALLLMLGGCATLPDDDDGVFSLALGDCFDSASGQGVIDEIPRVDCATPHDFEVYAVPLMTQDEFPGDGDTASESDARCGAAFEDFLGVGFDEAYAAGAYDYTTLYPTEESWALGDREIVCAITALDADGAIVKTTGSLAGVGLP
jgi:hypothetical protein